MRKIDWEAPLSSDDLIWLRQAGLPNIEARISENEKRFGVTEDEDEGSGEPGLEDDYDSWKLAELRAEAKTREAFPLTPDQIDAFTKKAPLIEVMRAWDKDHPDEE